VQCTEVRAPRCQEPTIAFDYAIAMRCGGRSLLGLPGSVALLLCMMLFPGRATAQDAFARVSPADAGYSAEALDELRGFLRSAGSESLLLLHDGKVFFEYGDIRQKRLVHSIRKALLSSLVGIENASGPCLALARTLGDFAVDDSPAPLTDMEKRATLEHVLQSRSGVYHPAAAETDGMALQRPARGSHAPGTHWYYNNWDFNVAGALYERCSGASVHQAFLERIARPIGMLDYEGRIDPWRADEAIDPATDGYRRLEPDKSRYPAYHFRMSAHDLALYGQLLLQQGRWKGQQLVPAAWIDASTRPTSIVNADQGLAYGMLWNVLVPVPDGQRASFYHTGLDMHMLAIYPEHGLVMVHRVNTERAFTFKAFDLVQIIRRVHRARRPLG
jgi:CubicO group peptidase (beta-lactamase class C family)